MAAEQEDDDLPEVSLRTVDVLQQDETAPLVAQTALREILRALGTAQSHDDCLRECALTLHQWTSADAASMYRLATSGAELVQLHSVGFSRLLTDMSRHLPVDDTLTGLAVQQRQLLFSQALDHDERISSERAHELLRCGMHSLVALPLITSARVVGAITLGWRRRLFLAEADRDLLMGLAYGVAIAVERAAP